jgi:hypothetical protein
VELQRSFQKFARTRDVNARVRTHNMVAMQPTFHKTEFMDWMLELTYILNFECSNIKDSATAWVYFM